MIVAGDLLDSVLVIMRNKIVRIIEFSVHLFFLASALRSKISSDIYPEDNLQRSRVTLL